ncbi:MAG: cobyrinate a,c-diamide synthase [bacterium]
MRNHYPRLVIAGMRGGSGKTILTAGIAAALVKRGIEVVAFKKGPDYIDAFWLGAAAGRPCRNLDTFMMDEAAVFGSFVRHAGEGGVALVEGNRGLFDGLDARGSHSTAALARLLCAPVVLVVECAKTSRTAAALVHGCRSFEPGVDIRGVILNRVAGKRHEAALRASFESACGVPVLGAVPATPDLLFPERHLGLLPFQEHPAAALALASCAELAEEHIDVVALLEAAAHTPPLPTEPAAWRPRPAAAAEGVRIGVARDSAFHFYYPENIEALAALGAEVVEFSPLEDARLPDVHAVYIGGGFPETHAEALADNVRFRESLRDAALAGLPVYAECGGSMYTGEAIRVRGADYPMAGVFPVVFGVGGKPCGHGYTILRVKSPNPYFEPGTTVRGHEFHYSYVVENGCGASRYAFSVERGYGFDGAYDGLTQGGAMAVFTHVHALGEPTWARALVALARAFARRREPQPCSL